MGKYGEEGNQLIFKILKRGEHEASGQPDLALRYDLTVPLARVIAHHQSKLPKLFKRYQIQPVWRADRPARGRFREFYQCDVDALGSTSPVIEAEVCAAVSDALAELGFADFTIRFNHRQLLSAVMRAAGIPETEQGDAIVVLDKLDRIGREGVVSALADRTWVNSIEWGETLEFIMEKTPTLDHARKRVGDDPLGVGAVDNLAEIQRLAANTSAGDRLRFDPSLARGLSYYTGAIFEINVPDLAGSLGGGGRYDNLVGMFLGKSVPACGFSLGLERIIVVMTERDMFRESVRALAWSPADVMVAVFDAKDMAHALRVASTLRTSGLRVMVYPDTDKIGKQIKYADTQRIPFVAILGGDEIANGTVTVKDLTAQTQNTYDQAAAGAAIVEGLKHRG
jgi:histidyl-tRNA synthetase